MNQSACNLATDGLGHTAICPQYFFSKDKVKEYNRKIENAVNSLVAQLKLSDGTDYDKALKVHDWFCENIEYDKIRDLLEGRGYDAKDQTRHGSSAMGKDAGNVDILIKIRKKPITLIEALRLESVKEKYISDHIDKIYKYDTLGFRFNFIISYVKTKDFKDFCNRYIKFVRAWKYPYELINCLICDSKQYPEIRTIEMILDREGIATKLYHILVHMPE